MVHFHGDSESDFHSSSAMPQQDALQCHRSTRDSGAFSSLPIHGAGTEATALATATHSAKESHDGGAMCVSEGSSAAVALKQGDSVAIAVDKGDAPGRIRNVMREVCSYIVVNEFAERLAYYGFVSSQVLFMQTELGFSADKSNVQTNIWSGAVYVFPLVGGWVADAHWGRYKTILWFGMLYLLALCIIFLTTLAQNPVDYMWAFYIGMYLVAVGAGGIKSNVSTLGADQYDESIESEKAQKESFFNWFYFSINVGACIAYTLVAYLCQDISFTSGYCIPVIAMALALVVFICGKKRYKVRKPDGSKLARFFAIIGEGMKISTIAQWHSIRNRFQTASGNEKDVGSTNAEQQAEKDKDTGSGTGAPSAASGSLSNLLSRTESQTSLPTPAGSEPDKQKKFGERHSSSNGVNDALSTRSSVTVSVSPKDNDSQWHHWLISAAKSHGGSYPDREVRDLLTVWRLLPIFWFTVIYWTIYQQMSTSFFLQGCQMDLAAGSLTVPVAGLNVIDPIAILILVPIVDRFIPFLQRRGVMRITLLQKIGFGYFISALAMAVAAIVEVVRLNKFNAGQTVGDSICVDASSYDYDQVPQMVAVSIFAQIPQFLLVGVSEVFASIGMYEFFYNEAPASMKSMCAALNLLTSAFGAYLAAALVPLVNSFGSTPWITTDSNHGELHYFFTFLCVLQMINLAGFTWWARSYQRNKAADNQLVEKEAEAAKAAANDPTIPSAERATSDSDSAAEPVVQKIASDDYKVPPTNLETPPVNTNVKDGTDGSVNAGEIELVGALAVAVAAPAADPDGAAGSLNNVASPTSNASLADESDCKMPFVRIGSE